MISNRILYECNETKLKYCEDWGPRYSMQEKMGFYDLVGFKTYKTGKNSSEKKPVYLHSNYSNGHPFVITKCMNNRNIKSKKDKWDRQWVGFVST